MDEAERLLQISLRMKAARHLRGHAGMKGATPMPIEDVAKLPELVDEGVTANRLTEIEQMKVRAPRRSELEAFRAALGMPADWFAGLYPSDRGAAVSGSLAELLLAVGEDVRALRREREAAAAESGRRGRRAGRRGDAA